MISLDRAGHGQAQLTVAARRRVDLQRDRHRDALGGELRHRVAPQDRDHVVVHRDRALVRGENGRGVIDVDQLERDLVVPHGRRIGNRDVERRGDVVERLLEFSLNGEADLRTPAGVRRVALRAVADRIDLLGDGTFRVFDYKLSKPPDLKRTSFARLIR